MANVSDRYRVVLSTVLSTLLAASCAHNPQKRREKSSKEAVRDHATVDFDCPKDDIALQPDLVGPERRDEKTSDTSYVHLIAQGCGARAAYTCKDLAVSPGKRVECDLDWIYGTPPRD